MLYVTLGQPFNVQPAGKVALYEKLGIGGIVRMNAFDGQARGRRVACATRSPGLQPEGQGAVVHRQPDDGMGDDTPPGELNRYQARPALRLPYIHGRNVKIAGTSARRT